MVSQSHLATRREDQLEERRARQQDRVEHGVIGDPRVRRQRQPSGEQPLLAARHLQGGSQQGVVGRQQPGRASRAASVMVGQPVALTLERVGGQLHQPCGPAREERRPVDRYAGAVRLGERADERLHLRLWPRARWTGTVSVLSCWPNRGCWPEASVPRLRSGASVSRSPS